MSNPRKRLRAVILTAVEVETNAIRSKVRSRRTSTDSPGVVLYESGIIDTHPVIWDVTLLETRQDNEPAAVLTERVIRDTVPDVVIFLGVAGRLKDATHGDIVVATGAYTYARGKETADGFLSRPDPLPTTERFKSVATYLRDHHQWRARIAKAYRNPPPRVHIGPIASGPRILEDEKSDTVTLIRTRYNDALAVDKESVGFLTAVRLNDVDACVVRAISDALSDKQEADSSGGQGLAAQRGAAFVVACLETYGRWFVEDADEPSERGTGSAEQQSLRSAARRTSAQVRTALRPYLLPAVVRPMVREVLIPAVTNSLAASQSRVIPVIAPAGYGKSTVLGQLHDELERLEGVAACLLRCDDIVPSLNPERELPVALGQAATGLPVDIRRVIAALTGPSCRGILLIDTLDQLLSPVMVAPLRQFLLALTEQQVTVVLTCRDFDYSMHLEPPGLSLPGVEVDRHNIPPFAEDEILAAAREFVEGLEPEIDKHASDVFLQRLLDLAVDRRRVLAIVACPLLLALLCESYGREGWLPADLSVTKLYDTHWDRKVVRGRGVNEPSSRGQARERYALSLAQACYEASGDRLQDTVDGVDLQLPSEMPASVADDLLSANILQQPRSGRLRFFHQTFLEYAVARWLGSASRRPTRLRLLQELRTGRGAHWWPSVRQLLTRSNSPDEVREILALLDLGALPPFRAAVYGVCARQDAAELTTLAVHAERQDAEFQITLLDGLSGVLAHVRQEAWTIAMHFAQSPDERVRSAATETLGSLLGQPSEEQPQLLVDLFTMAGPAPAKTTSTQEQ